MVLTIKSSSRLQNRYFTYYKTAPMLHLLFVWKDGGRNTWLRVLLLSRVSAHNPRKWNTQQVKNRLSNSKVHWLIHLHIVFEIWQHWCRVPIAQRTRTKLLLFLRYYYHTMISPVRPTWEWIFLYVAREPKWVWHPCLTLCRSSASGNVASWWRTVLRGRLHRATLSTPLVLVDPRALHWLKCFIP